MKTARQSAINKGDKVNIITKFDVGDVTNQGKVHGFDYRTEIDSPDTLRYWIRGGSRFYSEDELTAPPEPCGHIRTEGHLAKQPDGTYKLTESTCNFCARCGERLR